MNTDTDRIASARVAEVDAILQQQHDDTVAQITAAAAARRLALATIRPVIPTDSDPCGAIIRPLFAKNAR